MGFNSGFKGLSLVLDIFPLLCVLFTQAVFLKHFTNIFPRRILLQKYSKEMLFVHVNTFQVRTKTVTKKLTKHPLPGKEYKRDITELPVSSYTGAKRTCSALQT